MGQVARMLHCTVRTIRFYEERGLQLTEGRTGGQHRRYARADIQRLRGIIELRRSGLSLEQVTELIQLKRRHGTGAAAARAMGAALEPHLAAVGDRIAELKRIHDELQYFRTALAGCSECRRNVQRSDVCSECPRFPSGNHAEAALIDLWRHG